MSRGRAGDVGGSQRGAGWAARLADVRVLAVAVVAGTCLVYRLPMPVSPLWFVLALLPGVLAFPGRAAYVACLLAAAWTAYGVVQQRADRLPVAPAARVVWLQGRVAGLAESGPFRTRFVLARDTPPRRIRLSWYANPPALRPGDCVRVKAKIDTPHGSADPGTFDYEAWLWRMDIDATGYVKAARPCAQAPDWSFARLRATAFRHIDAVVSGSPMRGIVEALTLGVRSHISDAQWRVLRRTGTSHLVAISGLHIGLVAAWLFFLARWLVLRLAWRWPASTIAAAAGMAGALGYAALAGWALPTQRALVMVGAGLLAVSLMRDVAPTRMLAAAAIVVVGVEPDAVLSPGFWLSFGAVAWLLYLGRSRTGSRLRTGIRLQLGLVAGLIPFTLWFFGQASAISPLVNAILIPAAAFVVPIVLLAALLALSLPAIGAPLLKAVAAVLAAGWPWLAAASNWPLASFHLALPGIAAMALAVAGLVLLCAPRGIPVRWLGGVLVLPALVGWRPAADDIGPGAYRLTVLDVGQGLATVVQTRRHTLVFDAGPAYRTGFDAGSAIVVPYLRHVGRTRVDALVLSHPDMDHVGGAPALRAALDIGYRMGAESQHPCRVGQHWRWDGVRFGFVYPTRAQARQAESDNAHSCVLRISAPGGSTLLTGDLPTIGERRLLDRAPAAANVDVLVVGHHGSATSSSPAFIKAVSPGYALISAGWHNRWGFPAPAVVKRLQAAGARIADTASDGALIVNVTDHIRLRRWRVVHRRVWQPSLFVGGS